ncbi:MULTISPECIES: hypothetical protein [Mesorhizobium]|uniref:hypothetical protein n=1 Tax=Mesorhizobium australicum TaxID=536018 RepID=UPI003EC0D135
MAVYAGLFFAALIAATILPIQPEGLLLADCWPSGLELRNVGTAMENGRFC